MASVLLLLINDFVLKPQIGNALTGKLSDFAGLFAFPFFFAAFFAGYRVPIYVGTAAAFILWKSPLSGPWIDAWNSVSTFQVARVVDLSDLLALVVLPLSYWFAVNHRRVAARSLATLAIATVSLFAFAATSRPITVSFDHRFVFEGSDLALKMRLKDEGIEIHERKGVFSRDAWRLKIPAEYCYDSVYATVSIRGKGARTEMRLREMSHNCRPMPNEDAELLGIFMTKVVEPLGLRRL
ncbi:MAG TPA: hypothetical protein VF789_29090 [Thermoanaerobaculia bacterium]